MQLTSGEQHLSNMADNKRITEPFDPEKATVNNLKVFLRDRGVQISGTKAVLIDRAKGALNLNLRTLRELNVQDTAETNQRNVQKLLTPLNETLPDPNSLVNGWTADIMAIPSLTDNELYNYLVLNKDRTVDGASNSAKRQLKAKVFYEDRHIHKLSYHSIDENVSHAFVKCKVIPSYPTQSATKQPDYSVWICLSKVSGRVHSAGCTCSAG